MVDKFFTPAGSFYGIKVVDTKNRNQFLGFAQFDKVMGYAKHQNNPMLWDMTRPTTYSWWISHLLATVGLVSGSFDTKDLIALRNAIVDFMDARYEFIAAILETYETKKRRR